VAFGAHTSTDGASGASLPRAILLDPNDSGLVLARSLARRGVPVTHLAVPRYAWVTRSRGAEALTMPPPGNEETWLAALDELAGRGPGVLVPLSDRACELVTRRRERIPAVLRSFEGPANAHLELMDKGSLYDLARSVGIRVPWHQRVSTMAELDALAPGIDYPCLLKPVLSHEFRRLLGDRRVIVTPDASALRAAARPALEAGLEMLVAEYVPGPETALLGAVTVRRENGTETLAYTRRKLRQYPPFGAGSVLEAVPAPEVLAITRRLLDAAGFTGVSSLEAKRHAGTGEHVLMEINVRIPQNIGLGVACGVDAPWRIYATLAGVPLGEQASQRDGAKTIVASLEARAAPAYVAQGDLSLRSVLRSWRGVRDVSGLSVLEPAPLIAFASGQLGSALRVGRGGLSARVARPAPAAKA
jgi:predicted ATP-grasp superfamily ATP-dependent carboligase